MTLDRKQLRLSNFFHSVYEDYIVFSEEALEIIGDNIKYLQKGSLVFVPFDEKNKLLRIDPELEKMINFYYNSINKKLIESSGGIGAPKLSINKLIINRKQKDNIPSKKHYYNSINKKLIEIKIDGEDVKKIIARLRHKKRVTTSFYISEEILERFYKAISLAGIKRKDSGKVIEQLMLVFIEQVEKQLQPLLESDRE